MPVSYKGYELRRTTTGEITVVHDANDSLTGQLSENERVLISGSFPHYQAAQNAIDAALMRRVHRTTTQYIVVFDDYEGGDDCYFGPFYDKRDAQGWMAAQADQWVVDAPKTDRYTVDADADGGMWVCVEVYTHDGTDTVCMWALKELKPNRSVP